MTIIKTPEQLHIFNYRTGTFSDTMPAGSIMQQDLYNGFGYLDAVAVDTDGTYWLCKGRLLHYDPFKKSLKEYATPKFGCFPLLFDRQHRLWLGTDDAFSFFDTHTEKFTNYPYPVSSPNIPYSFLESIYEDTDGIFWLGTVKGLFRFNPANHEWKQYSHDPSDTSSLSFDVVFSICPDPRQPENYLWIGTNGGGLNRFDKRSGHFKRLTENDGLPNNVIYGILSDDHDNLWLSSNKGISCYSTTAGTFKNFEVKDGLQSNEFNRYAFAKATDGTMFFGGVNGFNYFKPGDLQVNPVIPEVIITDIKLKNQSISFRDQQPVIDRPAYLITEFALPYHDNVITFEFAAMEFSSPEKNIYQYMMDGFDREWIQAGTNHAATYTNLDPGDYIFRVKGSNNDGVWNETGATVHLVILPPWYMTWWFRGLLVVAIAAAVYLIYQYRLRQALKIQSVRNRIAQDLHDEVGSNLSSISIFTDMAASRSAKGEEVKPLLNKIGDYTRTSMEAMGDIVWMINSRNDRFENIIIHMRALAAELFEAKNYLLHLNISDELNSLKLGMDERKNFYLIYKEALNNIVKYAAGKNVWIDMYVDGSSVHLKIKDDGNGFDTSQVKEGNGLVNMQKRTEILKGEMNIASSPGNGTSIALRFTL